MKKWIAVELCLLALFSTFLLSGCSEKNELIGTWSTTVDLAETINQDFDQEDGDIAEYFQIDSLQLETRYTFLEDGTYRRQATEESVQTASAQFKEALQASLEEYFADTAKENGIDASVEEILEEAGTSLEAMADEILNQSDFESYVSPYESEGLYEYKDGKLYITASKEDAIDEETYITCEFVSNNELKLLEPFGEGSEEVKDSYPITLARVADAG